MNLRLIQTILNKVNPKKCVEIEIYPGSTIMDAAIDAIIAQRKHSCQIQFNFNDVIIKTFKHCNTQNLVNQYYHAIEDRR